MLYMIVRSLPRLAEPEQEKKMQLVERWMHSGIPQRVDVALEVFSLKFLRKTKVALLKADNVLTKHLQKKVKQNGLPTGNTAIDFSEIQTGARNGAVAAAAAAKEE